ncbi:MAG: homoserine dehydrogenase [Bacillota bacterium]|nr:homoserine dehydrogenase [Bacillota bacterium]MDK2855727.1 homoserine dehydrogenase [Bacillota bacterium]MDK2924693.1 homoserine dehydrogenase [Bacillota bacterium]
MKEKVNVGLLGLGTVGSGVAEVLEANSAHIAERAGIPLVVKKALVRNLNRPRTVSACPPLTTDPSDILADPEIDVVVEVLGGKEPALSYILAAMRARKHVVTANKELLAKYGKELFTAAEENQVDLYFEASVGGGIPIIRPLKECLAGNRIDKVYGIVNGTTNYILTQMASGKSYEDALKQAQAEGYAEADPYADVSGLDAARKIAILASIAFGARVTEKDVVRIGIERLSPLDLEYARELGYKVKLLARAQEINGVLQVLVHPALLPSRHPLASVDGVLNAIVVRGDAVGEVMFHGFGAGRLPTASAVVGDLIEVARNIKEGVRGRNKCTCFHQKPFYPVSDMVTRYFLRLELADQPGVLAKVAAAFGKEEVSLAAVIQKRLTERGAEVVLVTHPAEERRFRNAVTALATYPETLAVHQPIAVEGDA